MQITSDYQHYFISDVSLVVGIYEMGCFFVYVLFMFCLCSVHVLFMFCSCFVYVLFMFCLCSVHVLFMFCSCFVYVLLFCCPSRPSTGRSHQTAEVKPTPVSAVTSPTHVAESLPSGQLQPPHIGTCVRVCRYMYVRMYVQCTYVQSNLFSRYLEGHTKSVLLIRGIYYQYWLT